MSSQDKKRKCEYSQCRKNLPKGSREGKRFCNSTCRVLAWKEKNEIKIPKLLERIGDLERKVDSIIESLKNE